MAINFPGPWQVRIFYTITVSGTAIQHVQALNLDLVDAIAVGEDFSVAEPVYPGTPPPSTDLESVVDAWVAEMRAMYSNAAGNTIDRAELWRYEPESFDASFYSAYPISLAPTSGSSTQIASQSIVTMRTSFGGVFKLSFMESIIAAAVTDGGVISQANLEALVLGIEGGNYPWIGRDGGYPFARIAHYPGHNEALWKRRFRP